MNQIAATDTTKRITIRILCALTGIGTLLALIIIALAVWVLNFRSHSGGATSGQSDLTSTIANITLLIHFIGAIICGVGAKQMWNLKKKGFYYFVEGVLIPDVVSGSVFGSAFFHGASLIIFIVPIIFIALYGMHLKYMSQNGYRSIFRSRNHATSV